MLMHVAARVREVREHVAACVLEHLAACMCMHVAARVRVRVTSVARWECVVQLCLLRAASVLRFNTLLRCRSPA
jgi:hypothetical protein